MKSALYCLLLFFIPAILFAQSNNAPKKGSNIYIVSASKNENAQAVYKEVVTGITDWGYLKVVSEKQDANLIAELNIEASKGITATSWGGTSIAASVKLSDKNGSVIWESDSYKSSPNGTNSFNAKKAVARKIVKAFEKKFGE